MTTSTLPPSNRQHELTVADLAAKFGSLPARRNSDRRPALRRKRGRRGPVTP